MEKADILDLTVSYLFKVKSNNPISRRFTSTTVTSFPVPPPCDFFSPLTSEDREQPPRRVTSPLSCIPFDENNNAVGHVNLNYANYQQTIQTPPSVNYNDQTAPSCENEEIDIESIENDSLEDLNNSWTSSSSEEQRDDVTGSDDDHSAICEKEDKMWRPW